MRRNSLFLSLAMVLTLAGPAQAAPSDEEADKLTASIKSALGLPEDVLSVTVDEDGYNLNIDFSSVFETMKSTGVEMNSEPVDIHLVDQGAGKWAITFENDVAFTMKAKGIDLNETLEGATFDGVYDTNLSAFSKFEAKIASTKLHEDVATDKSPALKFDFNFEDAVVKGTAAANPGGGIDLTINQSSGSGSIAGDINDPEKGPTSFAASFKGAKAKIKAAGLRSQGIMKLLALLSSAKDKEKIDPNLIKSRIAELLPFTNTIAESFTLDGLNVKTAMGDFAVGKATIAIDANGVVSDGRLQETFKVENLSVPAAIVPPWAASLVPKNQNLDFTISGFDLAAYAKAYLAVADFNKTPPVTEQDQAKLFTAMLPKGTAQIEIGQSGVSNDTYQLKVSGTATGGPAAPPTGKGQVSLKGLDAITQALQGAPPEMDMKSFAGIAVLAKGLAKADADGTLNWEILATPDSKILVNGTDVKSLGK